MLVGVTLAGRVAQIEVAEEDILDFPRGLVGFENYSRFVLFEMEPPFYLLQAVDDPHLGFPLVDPFKLYPGYRAELSREECELLGLQEGDERAMLCVVALSRDASPHTVNLRAPVALNSSKKLGAQVVLQENRYLVRQPLAARQDGSLGLHEVRNRREKRPAGIRAPTMSGARAC